MCKVWLENDLFTDWILMKTFTNFFFHGVSHHQNYYYFFCQVIGLTAQRDFLECEERCGLSKLQPVLSDEIFTRNAIFNYFPHPHE